MDEQVKTESECLGENMNQNFLFATPPPPAIREAMAKAVERKQTGLPVIDFSSGNVGKLALNQVFFDKFELKVNSKLPTELKLLADGLQDGIVSSYHPRPEGLAYSPTGGTEPIKRLIVQYFRKFHGVPLSETETNKVIVTAGGQQAMTVSLRSLKHGTTVFLLRWEYAPIPGILKDHNLKEVRIEVEEDLSVNIEDLRQKVESDSVFYISMPNNPTGYFSPEDLKTIVEIIVSKDGGIIWDAPYLFTLLRLNRNGAVFERAFLNDKLAELEKIVEEYYDYLCILSSLSKTCLIAGLRFGFATASNHWIDNMNGIIGRENLSSPTPSFAAGTAILRRFLENPISHEWVCNILANRLTILIEEIPDQLMLPKNGMFGALYTLIRTDQEATRAIDRLTKEHGIITVPGSSFYGGPINAVRLSLVSVPWSEGDEDWNQSVRILKKAIT